MRREGNGEPERLCDLGHVLMRADLVGRDVLEHGARVGGSRKRPPGAGHARLRIDDDTDWIDRVFQRAQG